MKNDEKAFLRFKVRKMHKQGHDKKQIIIELMRYDYKKQTINNYYNALCTKDDGGKS